MTPLARTPKSHKVFFYVYEYYLLFAGIEQKSNEECSFPNCFSLNPESEFWKVVVNVFVNLW